MSEEKETSTTPPPKYSRYRSVRHTMHPESESTISETSENDVQRTKSMSRYRRLRVTSKPEPLKTPPIPEQPIPAVPTMPRANTITTRSPIPPMPTAALQTSGGRNPARRVTELGSTGPRSPRLVTDEKRGLQAQYRPKETEDERLRRKIKEFQDREEAKRLEILQKEQEERSHQMRKATAASQAQLDAETRQKAAQRKATAQAEAEAKLRAIQSREAAAQAQANAEARERASFLKKTPITAEADRAKHFEDENAKILAEQKKKDLERLQKELDAAVPTPPTPKLHSITSPMREKFSFFSRKKDAAKVTPPPTPKGSLGSPPATLPISKEPPRLVEKTTNPQQPKKIEIPMVDAPKKPQVAEKTMQIVQNGGGIVPQTDAPISASNAGERRVLVRCKQSSINLPITPETTPSDIIYSAANVMTQNIIPSTAILMESYTQLGLERRVRRYEHVRDVMNSWDRDTQNSFILQNSDSPKFDTDLEVSSVGKDAPGDLTVYMYHSQKPGKWNKRFITLLSTGQIYMSKKSGTKLSEKDAVNLCHLSDFDIYTPTAQQIRKTLKPPKKHCYAVKSQQKTTMFLSTENFVHFFSSDDQELAEKWYFAVQKWRSWYLVNRMGEGVKRAARKDEQQRPGTKAGLSSPADENPYTIGSFTPLFDLDSFAEGSDESSDDNVPRQVPFHLRNSISFSPEVSRRESRRHPPPVSYRLPPDADSEFTSTGLLGHTYSQRQREQKTKESAQSNGPFMDGPSLLNGGTQRTASMASTKRPHTSGDALQRSSSRSKPKPLLDFTPQFKEAPQWDRTHKGRGVAPIMGLPLVETATTPATGLDDIPKSTVFRRETVAARPGTGTTRGGQGPLLSGLSSPKGNGSILNRGRVGYD